jgi:hypothetical protein
VDWPRTWEHLRAASAGWLLVALGSVVLNGLLRAERWRLMFAPDHQRLRVKKFFSVFLIGQMVNAVVPARLGEVARAVLIGEIERVSKARALWTTLLEKLLDVLVLLVALGGLSWLVPLPEWLAESGWLLSAVSVAVVAALVMMVLARQRVAEWIAALEGRWGGLRRLRLGRLFGVVAESTRLWGYGRASWGILGWSVAAFLLSAGSNWLTAFALGLRLSYKASLLLLIVLQISAVVPLPTSPGRVGVFHLLCVLTLALFGIEREVALSYSLVLHVLTYLPMMVGGPLCLWLENYNWRSLARLMREGGGGG